MQPKGFSNLDYYNNELLLSNQQYALLEKLKLIGNSVLSPESGLDYYKMWLSHYNRNKNSITEKSNVENYMGYIVKSRIRFLNILVFLENHYQKEFKNLYKSELMEILIDFVFDNKNIDNILKYHEITQKDLMVNLELACNYLKKYWNVI